MEQARAEALLAQASRLIAEADALMICAGAGMGVDSGLPDFRGTEGFWQAYPALGRARMRFEQIASPRNFVSNPALAWGFYGHRLQLYRQTLPHQGFDLLRHWGQSKPGGYFVFTSNVDGQFQKADFDASHIEECHGSIHYLQCSTPCSERVWSAQDVVVDVDEDHCVWRGALPTCPDCGAVLRPNILMFDDWHWIAMRRQLQQGNRKTWLERLKVKGMKPLIIELGAGTAISTVRHFAVKTRQDGGKQGARLLRINPREAAVSGSHDVGLPLGALAALEAIAQRLPDDWKCKGARHVAAD